MNVEINGKDYDVKEFASKWVVKIKSERFSASYDVKKSDCSTLDELKKFLIESKIL